MTEIEIYKALFAYLKIKKAVGRSPMLKIGHET